LREERDFEKNEDGDGDGEDDVTPPAKGSAGSKKVVEVDPSLLDPDIVDDDREEGDTMVKEEVGMQVDDR
jgi:hypothetical protein